MKEIIKRDMALTVCPLSNTALQVVKDLKDHPLKKMMALGLKATINSDDPAHACICIHTNQYIKNNIMNLISVLELKCVIQVRADPKRSNSIHLN